MSGKWEGFYFWKKLRSLREVMKFWNTSAFGDTRIKKTAVLERIKFLDGLVEQGVIG